MAKFSSVLKKPTESEYNGNVRVIYNGMDECFGFHIYISRIACEG